MLQMNQDFNSSFSENCQITFVPQSLLSTIYMLTNSAQHESDDQAPESFKPAISIAQLTQFNSTQKQSNTRHCTYSAGKETLLTIYIASGLCISYHCMLSLSKSIRNTVCCQFE